MQKLISLAQKISQDNTGKIETFYDDIEIFISKSYIQKQLCTYEPSIIFNLQGTKKLSYKNKEIIYDQKNYLVVSSSLPLECETFATKKDFLIGVKIKLDFNILQNLSEQINMNSSNKTAIAPDFASKLTITKQLEESLARLLETLNEKEKSMIFTKDILKEIFYLILKQDQNMVLLNLVKKNSNSSKIAKTINFIKENLNANFLITKLAKTANMSCSSFYKLFKISTGYSPIQFIKKMRLAKAKEMLVNKDIKIKTIAYSIGYKSTSQFNREYKRTYKISPKQEKL